MLNIDITEAGGRFPELIAQSIGGGEIIITRDGQPVVKLVALVGPERKRRFGSARELIKISDDFDEPLEDFRGYM
uniref:Antitoxin component of toxin-antitoxin stability system, DNA-binding transcriptional repressor n=2 Tax=unclassified Candidatus Kentrum TaxID=2643149 RepID=A0A450Z0X9_9GAMM|nr:MAG: Antitoxin component of toxin-antitoxin stability system, DNA-binding transcriptional repressor [Candidatus Kentron sp. SD]VFK47417.1 MAG: Antitoxin component of toxin-antitoxin stability system, DNA-binding transcriptional repressor [Candidatus Kentron sp. SD]VFK62810.1 MAG: Antitoxin component of toxin-antitoxin stability system, DNA-binding transcriptional repressor [Candidatus Kentron sp. UNK]VFK70636.1 MAG: Antitoxin component of toxin-antitoxin stability system, DNA-binding transcri